MKNKIISWCIVITISCFFSCSQKKEDLKAEEILGNPNYQALSFGAYRYNTRDSVPSVKEIKEDLRLTEALGVKLLRTYNTQHYAQAENLLKAIKELKQEDANFEMYVMLGAWIQCKDAWSSKRNHNEGDIKKNKNEIDGAVSLAKEYPDIVKIIAVGNEAMIHWADGYFVSPKIILKWVDYLQDFKKKGILSKDLWVTSSDNYEAWGGGDPVYRTKELEALIKAVDFVSLHTYPYHATNYQPEFWGIPNDELDLSNTEKIEKAMKRSISFAISQYQSSADYIASLGIEKEIHIGETGWATIASRIYGDNGSHAADEYKEKLFYEGIREWTNKNNVSCFYFKLMDESWKNKRDPLESENHFGLINQKNEAKYALWNAVDQGAFKGLLYNGKSITKTFNGDKNLLTESVLLPPTRKEIGILKIKTVSKNRQLGNSVSENKYIVSHNTFIPNTDNQMTYPSKELHFNAIDGTCKFKMTDNNTIEVTTGTGKWWACALNIDNGKIGEDLTNFKDGFLNFDIKGDTESSFSIGFQTGNYTNKTLELNAISFNDNTYTLTTQWKSYSIAIKEMNANAKLNDVTSVLSFKGLEKFDGEKIELRNVFYSKQ